MTTPNKELPWRATDAINDIQTLVSDYEAVIAKLQTEVKTITNIQPFQPLLPYRMMGEEGRNIRGYRFYDPRDSNSGFRRDVEEPKMSIDCVTTLFESDKLTYAKNEAIVKINTDLLATTIALFKRFGLSETTFVKSSRRPYKSHKVVSDWLTQIKAVSNTFDSQWNNVQNYFNDYNREVGKYTQYISQKAHNEKLAKDAEKAKREADIFTATLLVKYGLSSDATIYDINQALLKQNKYLMLGHYLEANRNDWSDGPDQARTGLDNFVVQNPPDSEILAEISQLINNWDGDGRCFRDCTWNYSALYAIAAEQNPELVKDYTELLSKIAVSQYQQ